MPRQLMLLLAAALAAAPAPARTPVNGGPYNVRLLEGGIGIGREAEADDPVLAAAAPMSFTAWVRPAAVQPGEVPLLTLGAPGACRCLLLKDGRPMLRLGNRSIAATAPLPPGVRTHVAATYDGRTARLYVAGREAASGALPGVVVSPAIGVAPVFPGAPHFGGELAAARIEALARPSAGIAAEAARPPHFELVQMLDVGVGWEFQRTANIGLFDQQDAWTLPVANATSSLPVAKPVTALPPLAPAGDGRWQLNGWTLAAAPDAAGTNGIRLSRAGPVPGRWLAATVPGTILTTLVDRGIWPDPYIGLNNMAIPESLARQDWWYRASFTVPPEAAGRRLALRFDGINYAAEIWLNGVRLGDMKGAFIHGEFPFAAAPGVNAVAVRVSPPPHPGIPHEQSILAGPGENGGQLALDGPTFAATEGWDWIPAMRDRNTGLWRPIVLIARGVLTLGDPQIVTDLPLPRTDSADLRITVPVANAGSGTVIATIHVMAGPVAVTRTLPLPPGETMVSFTPATDPALRLASPELWWPNGMGAAKLHDLIITAETGGTVSDAVRQRFGIREFTYELSLFDHAGRLRRVEIDLTDASRDGIRPVDQRHGAIKQSPGGWTASLALAAEASPAVRDVPATMTLPHLTIRVNGIAVAARGGNWGMDDAMKRGGRAALEPAFRLHREANLNIIRNWMGTSTEAEFYDLADEYGMLVLNDFWQSTQNFQLEPGDPQLFLANAADTIRRARNHPSIVVWFGRNEGLPAPILQAGLDDLTATLDGTRLYLGSSNTINLQGSGPYNYRPPAGYFTDLASGFSVETGSPSLATLEAVEAMVPGPDRWPLSDTLAYHDWHFGGNGDTRTFMASLAEMFGPATSLADFERKAQMMNLETYKAMFEGFLAHLWTKNSGRLLWMTHPAWPSNAWQIYSSDFDTHAAYYGVKRAAEPLHAQMNLPDFALAVVNTSRSVRPGLTLLARVLDLSSAELYRRSEPVVALANRTVTLAPLPLGEIFRKTPLVFVTLRLTGPDGEQLSDNFYWQGRTLADVQGLNTLPQQALTAAAARGPDAGADAVLTVTLANPGPTPALAAKLTLLDRAGQRILPAYYSDNYVALLPGEQRTVTIRAPRAAGSPAAIGLRGWNVAPMRLPVPAP